MGLLTARTANRQAPVDKITTKFHQTIRSSATRQAPARPFHFTLRLASSSSSKPTSTHSEIIQNESSNRPMLRLADTRPHPQEQQPRSESLQTEAARHRQISVSLYRLQERFAG